MPQNTQNRVALITGAAKRLGAAVAQHLQAQGWKVIIHCHHSLKEANALCSTLNDKRADSAHVLQADLADPNSYHALISSAAAVWDRLDAVVNNASVFFPNTLGKTTAEEWNTLWATNVTAPFFLTQAAIPFLEKTKGSIVNITDTHADGRPIKHHSVYSMTKAALTMQTQALARELAPSIRVNAVAPGVSLWDSQKEFSAEQKEILNRTPLKRAAEAEEIAKAVSYLLNDATYTTGSVMYVDGGRALFN